MFAEVYPLTRLPRRFTFFDYKIPDKLNVQVGDVVKITIKNRPVFGIVKHVKEKTEIKRIADIEQISAHKFFSKEDIERIETIAHAIFQSPSNLFVAALQGWKPRNTNTEFQNVKQQSLHVDKIILEEIKKSSTLIENGGSISLQTSQRTEQALIYLLQKKIKHQLLIVCPKEQDTKMVAINLGKRSTVLHGHTKNRDSVINAWNQGKIKTLIGTRQASLIPAKKIDLIYVCDAGADEYEKLDRNPRFDARTAAKLLAKQHNASIIFSGRLPRIEELSKNTPILFNETKCEIIDMNSKEEHIGIPLLSQTLLSKIESTLEQKKRALLLYNKKGVASHLQCTSCGYIPLCGTCGAVPTVRLDDLVCHVCNTEMWSPKNCPSCKKPKLKEKNIGNQRIVTALQKQFPNSKIQRIDKDHKEKEEDQTNILLVTEYYFKNYLNPFDPKQLGLVADIAFDLTLTGDDFRTSEHANYKLHRLAYFSRDQKADCYIQTWLPNVAKSMLKAKKWLKNEEKTRETYKLPPIKPLFTLVDKTNKIRYKEPLKNFFDAPDSTIILADVNDYEHLPGS